jgi:hypothetical protein
MQLIWGMTEYVAIQLPDTRDRAARMGNGNKKPLVFCPEMSFLYCKKLDGKTD